MDSLDLSPIGTMLIEKVMAVIVMNVIKDGFVALFKFEHCNYFL